MRILGVLGKIIDQASGAAAGVGAAILVLMAGSVIFEVIMRLLGMPTKWVTEFCMYGLVAVTFFGAAHVAKIKKHIVVDVIVSRLSDRTRKPLELLTLIWGVAFCIIFSYSAIVITYNSWASSVVSPTILRVPMWIPQGAVVVGAILLTLQLIKLVVNSGALMTKVKGDAEKPETFLTPIDKPSILLPIVISLLTVGTVLFYMGGSLRIIGFVVLLFSVLAMGIPVFLALAIMGSLGFFFVMGGLSSQVSLASLAYGGTESFVLSALPLFVFAGGLFALSGMTGRLFDVCNAWLSFLPGNLAMATIASCAIFAAMSGSSTATAAAIGMIAIPAMIARGYDKGLAVGAVAAAGTLGSMIPPSNQFILYGDITGTSVGQLFIGGIFPGLFIALMFMSYIYFKCRGDIRYKPEVGVTWRVRLATLKDAWGILLAPLIIIGGIYTGIFTPTESAAVAVLYGIILCVVARKLRVGNMLAVLRDCAAITVMILMIVAGAKIFGGAVTILQIAQGVTQFAITSPVPPWGVVVVIMILTLILGMFMDGIALTLIVVPITFSAMMAMGYDPVWYGILFCLNMEIGLVTPPVGITLYVARGVSGVPLETVIRGAIPFVLIMLMGLVVIGLFEPMSTWLPSTMIR